MNTGKLSLLQITRKFLVNESAEKRLVTQRWRNGVQCHCCASITVFEREEAGERAFHGVDRSRDFSTQSGSLMHDSKLGFRLGVRMTHIYENESRARGKDNA